MMAPKKSSASDNYALEEIIPDNKKVNGFLHKKRKQGEVFITLAVVLIVISAVLAFFGFIYYDDEVQSARDKKSQQNSDYKLFVTHSNSYYGGENVLFKNHSSESEAYVYRFDVDNKNLINLDYIIKIQNSNFGKDNIDMKSIYYSLLKENVQIAFGTLKNSEFSEIEDMAIKANAKDSLSLRIWSNSINNELSFSFKVIVDVEGGSHE